MLERRVDYGYVELDDTIAKAHRSKGERSRELRVPARSDCRRFRAGDASALLPCHDVASFSQRQPRIWDAGSVYPPVICITGNRVPLELLRCPLCAKSGLMRGRKNRAD